MAKLWVRLSEHPELLPAQVISATVFHPVTLIRQPQLYNQNKDVFIRREAEIVADLFVHLWCRTTTNTSKIIKIHAFSFFFSP